MLNSIAGRVVSKLASHAGEWSSISRGDIKLELISIGIFS